MLGMSDAVAEVVRILTAADIDATDDPRHLRVPGVLVQYVAAEVETLDGSVAHQLRALCVAADRDDPRTLATLDQLASDVVDQIAPAGPLTPTGVLTTTQPTPLPGLAVPITVTYRQE